LLEHVEPGAGEPALMQSLRKSTLVDDRAPTLTSIAVAFISESRSASIR
jgi:hypothetical protein